MNTSPRPLLTTMASVPNLIIPEDKTYLDSVEGVISTHDRVIQELRNHDVLDQLEEFYDEFGKRDTYLTQNVLLWLGY